MSEYLYRLERIGNNDIFIWTSIGDISNHIYGGFKNHAICSCRYRNYPRYYIPVLTLYVPEFEKGNEG